MRWAPEADACIEIMTGAALPAGADCVVPYEDTERDGPRVRVAAGAEIGAGYAVHRRGSDHRAGEVIVPAGTRLTGCEIAVAAACGCASCRWRACRGSRSWRRATNWWTVDAPVAPHQIRRSNDYALAAALSLAGYVRNDRFLLRDSPAEIGPLLARLIADYDVLLVTGGVSKGKFDFLPAELDRQGVKKAVPGRGAAAGQTPVVWADPARNAGFRPAWQPGRLGGVPAPLRAAGARPGQRPGRGPVRRAALAAPAQFRPKLAWFLPVRVTSGPQAELAAYPGAHQHLRGFCGLVGTDGFVELPPSERVPRRICRTVLFLDLATLPEGALTWERENPLRGSGLAKAQSRHQTGRADAARRRR